MREVPAGLSECRRFRSERRGTSPESDSSGGEQVLEEQVREIARMQGADLVGLGSVDRFSDAPEVGKGVV